jgi:hypothetical protein
MAEGRKVETEDISIVEAPFYDLLKSNLQTENENEIQKTKELIHTLLLILKDTAAINNFWNKLAEQKLITGRIEDEIRYSRIEGLSSKATEMTTELMKLAKNREADLR